MKILINISKIVSICLLMLFASCKKDRVVAEVDLMQHYIAGKFTFQQGPELPFALIPTSANKAWFVCVSEKREVDYTFENNKLTTNINGGQFTCDFQDGKLVNIAVNSATLGIPVAALNKKQDAELSLTGKRYEAPIMLLNTGAVLFDNYYFKFDNDAAKSYYTSNPTSGNYIITTKAYEKLADGCFYNEQTKAFGVILNNKLEVETKIGNDYVLFSGTRK